MSAIRLVIHGAPRTKKNHGSVILRAGRKVHIPSAAWTTWAMTARIEDARTVRPRGGLARPMNAAAIFYRDADRGDAVGYYQGLADLLQQRGIVANDKFLVSWDGSRLLKDAADPRVELVLTPVAA